MNGASINSAPHTTILYVDEAETARKNFERACSGSYTVLTASDAPAAIALLRGLGDRIGIIFTKGDGPDFSGRTLLRQVAEEFPGIIRILATSNTNDEVLRKMVRTGEVFRVIESPQDDVLVSGTLQLAASLAQSRRARQQRLQAIEESMAFVSYELNTPLSAILNFARGMQRRLTDVSISPQQQAELWKASLAVDENVRYCIALLSSFAETVKAASPLPGLPAASTAHQLVISALDNHPLTHDQRNMIRVELEEDFPVSVLPNCVALVLSSLLSGILHSLKDTSAPSISFTVTASDHPHIRITNNGPGIAPEILDKLALDSVADSDDSSAAERGLAFCKRIMQMFGGEMMIRSVQGVYTSITLYFPPAKSAGAPLY